MSLRKYVYAVMSGLMAGVFYASVWSTDDLWFGFFLLTLSLVLFVCYRIIGAKTVWILLLLGFIFGSGLGYWRFIWYQSGATDLSLDPAVGQTITLTGTVVNFPAGRENSKRIVVQTDRSKVLAFIRLHQAVTYGDQVTVRGRLKYPENFITDLGRTFDYVHYLEARGIRYELVWPEVLATEPGSGNFLVGRLFEFKAAFLHQLARFLPEPHSALAGGILLGVQESLGEELEQSFRRTGLIHIVVLSGYNITIIADSLRAGLSFLPFYYSLSAGAVSIIAFAFLVGGGPTVVRATIMALAALLARATGRIYDATLALLIAGLLMVLHNPLILVYDVGFQLSFIASFGLIILAPVVEPGLNFLPRKFGLRELATATISAQIAVLPWLWYKIGELSLVALPVNLLVLPVVPPAMLASFLTGLVAFVWAPPAAWLSFITFGLLDYVLVIVRIFDGLPYSALPVPWLPFWLVLLFYLAIGWWAGYQTRRLKSDQVADRSDLGL